MNRKSEGKEIFDLVGHFSAQFLGTYPGFRHLCCVSLRGPKNKPRRRFRRKKRQDLGWFFGGETRAGLQLKFAFSSDGAKRARRYFAGKKTPKFSAVLLAPKRAPVAFSSEGARKKPKDGVAAKKTRLPAAFLVAKCAPRRNSDAHFFQTALKTEARGGFVENNAGFSAFFFLRRNAYRSAIQMRIFFGGS